MNPTNVPAAGDDATICFCCGKKIADGHWFARLPYQSRLVVFCRPFCVESFLEQQENAAADQAAARRFEG